LNGLGLEDPIAYVIPENVELSPISVDGTVEYVEAPRCAGPARRSVQGFDKMPSQMSFRAKGLDFFQFFGHQPSQKGIDFSHDTPPQLCRLVVA
jgi:hypothetical protein